MPVDVTGVPSMYVFVDIGIDVAHLVDSVRLNFKRGARLALAGTIQFAGSIQVRLTARHRTGLHALHCMLSTLPS